MCINSCINGLLDMILPALGKERKIRKDMQKQRRKDEKLEKRQQKRGHTTTTEPEGGYEQGQYAHHTRND